jgi:hypothetical protein
MVMRSLIQAVYRFRDATLVDEKKGDFGSALQNLYRELERAENLAAPLDRSTGSLLMENWDHPQPSAWSPTFLWLTLSIAAW